MASPGHHHQQADYLKWVCICPPHLGQDLNNPLWHDDVIKWKHFPRCFCHLPVTGKFPSKRPVMQGFDAFFDLHMNKWLSKQPWGWWFETPSCPLWRHCNDVSEWRNDMTCKYMIMFHTKIHCDMSRVIISPAPGRLEWNHIFIFKLILVIGG